MDYGVWTTYLDLIMKLDKKNKRIKSGTSIPKGVMSSLAVGERG